MHTLIIEAFIIGIFGTIINVVILNAFCKLNKTPLNNIYKTWNKFYILEFSTFFAHFIMHMLSEYIGLNKWYCTN